MILGDKIAALRKQNGWSQEDLAQKLEISRQSVSKWESGASIPDLDKIIRLSGLFGVSTDYLLKDEIEEINPAAGMSQNGEEEEENVREVSLQEANDFTAITKEVARPMAGAVSACILSPIPLILLGGIAEYKKTISENMAGGIGVIILLAVIASAVAVMISKGMKLSRYEYLEKEIFSLQYGVKGIVEKQKEEQQESFRRGITVGVVLCIISVVPLMIAAALDMGDYACVWCVGILLVIIAIAVFMFVSVGMPRGSYDKLLQVGDYTAQKKELDRKTSAFPGIYWCIVTAIYLGISLWKNNWNTSWIIWPVAGVLFAALYGLVRAAVKKS